MTLGASFRLWYDAAMNVRKATSQDVPAIHSLGESVHEFSVNDETVTFWPVATLERAVESDDVLILVAEDDAIIGFVIANCNHGLKKTFIENIYVESTSRGRGVGDALLTTLFQELRAIDCEYVATLVPLQAENAAHLYTRYNFSRGEQFVWYDQSLAEVFKRS